MGSYIPKLCKCHTFETGHRSGDSSTGSLSPSHSLDNITFWLWTPCLEALAELRIFLTSEGRVEREAHIQIGALCALTYLSYVPKL